MNISFIAMKDKEGRFRSSVSSRCLVTLIFNFHSVVFLGRLGVYQSHSDLVPTVLSHRFMYETKPTCKIYKFSVLKVESTLKCRCFQNLPAVNTIKSFNVLRLIYIKNGTSVL